MTGFGSDSILPPKAEQGETGQHDSGSVTPPASRPVPGDSTGTAQAAAAIVTPLTYGDALDLAEAAMADGPPIESRAASASRFVLMRDRIARAILAVDQASREQSGAKALAEAVLAYDAAIQRAASAGKSWVENDALDALYGAWLRLARAVIPESEPIADVEARINRGCVK